MLNKTSLLHVSVGIKIHKAMQIAVKTGLPQYVVNRKGQSFLRVVYRRGFRQVWQFMHKNYDVTKTVLIALKLHTLPVAKPTTITATNQHTATKSTNTITQKQQKSFAFFDNLLLKFIDKLNSKIKLENETNNFLIA